MADKVNLKQLLDRMDDEDKHTFSSMTDENKMLVLLSIELSNSNRLAKVERKQITFEEDVRRYRSMREKKEDNGDTDVLNTTQKILNAIADAKAKEFNVWLWIRDKVLPQIVTAAFFAIIVIMGLIATGKFP